MRQCILQWFIHLRARGLRKGDEHPAYTARDGAWNTLAPDTSVAVGRPMERSATGLNKAVDLVYINIAVKCLIIKVNSLP